LFGLPQTLFSGIFALLIFSASNCAKIAILKIYHCDTQKMVFDILLITLITVTELLYCEKATIDILKTLPQ
jgi:hypothetical protein